MVVIEVNRNDKRLFVSRADRLKWHRKDFLYRMLGNKCSNCSVKKKKGVRFNIHHVFYPFGFRETFTKDWQYGDDDIFWNVCFPEIMMACILLCRKCHRDLHVQAKKNGIRFDY